MDESDARQALGDAARQLDRLGLNQNSSGNLSVRVGGGVLVTPSGIPAAEIEPADLVLLDADGHVAVDGQRTPTSEWRLHAAVYGRRPDVGAIVHTHSIEATAASTVGVALPPVHYVAARFGGRRLRCAPYATYGTDALAANVAGELADDGMACLMANHGAIAVAGDLGAATALAIDVEWFCAVFRRAAQLGDPVTLDDAELDRVADRFASYGQR